jgi:hypothetical protein
MGGFMNEDENVVSILHLGTLNDVNGNPRRLWLGLDKTGHVIKITDEGYTGRPRWVREANSRGLWEFHTQVPTSTYDEWKNSPLCEEAG